LIGHPKGGTIALALQAAVGRRIRLILPAGLERRVFGDLTAETGASAELVASGWRLWC